MDFDEYEYLEKTVENPELEKVNEAENGGVEREKDRSRSSKHRSDDSERNSERSSKRSKSSGEKSQDHERHGSSRHRSRSRDGERDRHRSSREYRDKEREREKDRDREERNGTGKEKSRDRDGDRDHVNRDRDRDHERSRGKERERETRVRSDKLRDGQDEIEREKGRDKDRERPMRERDRDHRRHKDKKEEAEPEADPERDQRTVFAYQINLKADERDVYEFFSRAGKVRDVRLIMDRISRRSKGVGYVEFYDAMSVPMAIALSGQPLLGIPVMVKPSEAEKNLVQSTASAAAAAAAAGGAIGPYSGGARRLYVGNLVSNLTPDQLKKIFEPFGEVELVQLPLDESGSCKGFGFVQFARLEDARNALSLNGLEIAGRTIKVSAVTDQPGTQDVAPTSGDFDDDDGGGLSLNASSRAMLMKKLDRSGTASSITEVNGTAVAPSAVAPLMQSAAPSPAGIPFAALQLSNAAVPAVNSIGVPSECLLLTNMFDPSVETEPDFDLDIMEDVQEESAKYGKLKHIYVDKNSAGLVYLRFENAQAAIGAQRALHGRWFAGKMISATFMVPGNYETKFPESR